MALAADRLLQKKSLITLQNYKVAANAVIHYGAIVATNASGFLVPASDTAGLNVVGIAEQAADNTGGADGAIDVQVYRGAALVPTAAGAPVTQALVGGDCLVADDEEVAATTTNSIVAGEVLEVTSAGVWVNFAGKR